MADATPGKTSDEDLLRMTARIVAAYVRNNRPAAGQIGDIIASVYGSFRGLDARGDAGAETHKPAVPVKKSVTPEFLICLEDGKKLKMLKRHLRTTYNLTPDAYRRKWGLPSDYPMVAPNYAKARSAFAKQIGLGRGGRPAGKRGRKKSSE